MDKAKRKALIEAYKKEKVQMGLIQIRNETDGRIFIRAWPNLKNQWLSLKSQLNAGRFANAQLQQDWKRLGEEAFTYSVLEEKERDPDLDPVVVRRELKKMYAAWHEKLQPFGERGYNKESVD